jgi:trimethylamine--corrinoid protein Co-methyltransferase
MSIEGNRPHRPGRRPRPHDGSAAERPTDERYRRLQNPFTPLRVLADDQVEELHRAALAILETTGIRVLLPEARSILAAAGASVDEPSQMVRFDRGLVEQALSGAPSTIEMAAPHPARNVTVGGNHLVIAPVAGPPNAADLERGRRPGSLRDFRELVMLSQSFDIVHMLAPLVEPQDVPMPTRHLETMLAQLSLSDKIPFIYSRGHPQVADCFEMIRIAHGISEADFLARPYTFTNINTNSPLQLDIPMSQGIIDFATAGQLLIVTPFTLSGAMAPVTLAGAVTLAHAEALAGVTLAQIVRRGAPVVYGGFTSNVDMKSGSPAFGTPEYVRACFATGQLARRVGLPWRSSNATAANVVDGQAAYESEMSLWGALLGGCNLLIHGAGWMEGGLCASYEKFIVDIEMLQMMAEVFRPFAVTAAEIGADAIAEVGPGGHFFSTAHTMERYRTAFYSPLVSDWRNFGQWSEDGARTVTQRATPIWKRCVQEFVPPPRDPAVLEALSGFVARRTSEGGAPPIS